MTQNQIAYQAHLENKRANEAREFETHRSNMANENENRRYHTESIREQQRSNQAREAETNRSNLANEMLKATDIRTRSADNRYAADVGYKGRVESAYISKWGVSPADASALASTVGGGVKKLAPKAVGVARGAFGLGNIIATYAATAPFRAVRDAGVNVKKYVNKIVQQSNKSTHSGNSTQNKTTNKIGGRRNVKTKKF